KRSTEELMQAAMRAGVRELVDFSVGGEELLRDAVGRAFGWSAGLRSTRHEPVAVEPGSDSIVLSVFASRGGAGKKFVGANIAAAIASKSGQDTAILDLDLETGEAFDYFGREVETSPRELLSVGRKTEPA